MKSIDSEKLEINRNQWAAIVPNPVNERLHSELKT